MPEIYICLTIIKLKILDMMVIFALKAISYSVCLLKMVRIGSIKNTLKPSIALLKMLIEKSQMMLLEKKAKSMRIGAMGLRIRQF